jgi:hypothetical protein
MSSRSSLMFLSVNGRAESYGTTQDVPCATERRHRPRGSFNPVLMRVRRLASALQLLSGVDPRPPVFNSNPRYSRRMARYLFNFSDGDREEATVLLRAKMWEVGRQERHRDALAPGDPALLYLPAPDAALIGRAELARPIPASRRAECCCRMSRSGSPLCQWRRSCSGSIRQHRTRSCRRTPRPASEWAWFGLAVTNTRPPSLSAARRGDIAKPRLGVGSLLNY